MLTIQLSDSSQFSGTQETQIMPNYFPVIFVGNHRVFGGNGGVFSGYQGTQKPAYQLLITVLPLLA